MERVSRRYCFKDADGEDIYLFTLRNENGTEVSITNYGAILTSFRFQQRNGDWNDIVLGFDDPASYLSGPYLEANPFFGASVGRYANRIKDARFVADGITYDVVKNNYEDHLHGGLAGFDKKTWRVEAYTGTPHASLELRVISPDGDEGYPGTLDVSMRWELNDQDELTYTYTASTDKSTPLNLSHHSYFNLNNGNGNIKDHVVSIRSAEILEQDDNFVTTGNFVEVKNTIYDFTKPRSIEQSWNAENGFDQSFVLPLEKTDKPAAVVYSNQSGLQLEIFTSEPVVHLYTGRWIPELKGKNGTLYGHYSGLCLETQTHPNAINIPHFPSTLLRPAETYRSTTTYRIKEL